MNIRLSVTSPDLTDDEIQILTRNICTTINTEVSDTEATLPEEVGSIGTKGDVVTIGTLILTLIGSGGVAVSLVNVLKGYIERGRNLKVKIKKGDGAEIEIEASNLSSWQINQTTELVNKVLEGGDG